MKKSVSVLLLIVCILNVFAIPTFASLKDDVINAKDGTTTETKVSTTSKKTTFTDVDVSAWYYNYVTQCVEKGLMQGMGDGTFSPTTQMTVAQFMTVAVNASYSSELSKQPDGVNWWDKAYQVALDKGLITTSEYSNTASAMNTPITRKEMARIASRVTVAKGETKKTLTSTSLIADYSSIGDIYKSYVEDCFAKGILTGVDSKGTFNPDGVLTRAEGCTVALKLIDASVRSKTQNSVDVVATEKHTWKVGEPHTNLPQVGDVVIKEDGTRVTLEIGPGGVLGACQGVDIYSGLIINGKEVKDGSLASIINGTPLRKDPITSEMHSEDDWVSISAALYPLDKPGGYKNGEIVNTWFRWDDWGSGYGAWVWLGPSC